MVSDCVIAPEALRDHWQGHRRLTRRVIQAFPENQLFTFSIGSMRPFGHLATEIVSLTAAGILGLATGQWIKTDDLMHRSGRSVPTTRDEILRLWDETTSQIETLWPQIRPGRFQEIDTAFGQWEGTMYAMVLYWIDNEVHHRGQGYVYLRALGIEPPPFYVRA